MEENPESMKYHCRRHLLLCVSLIIANTKLNLFIFRSKASGSQGMYCLQRQIV